MKKLNIFLVLDETPFHHPNFAFDLIKKLEGHNIQLGLVTKVKPKSNLLRYLILNFYVLKISEMFKLGMQKVLYSILNLFNGPVRGSFYSIRKVAQYTEVPFFEMYYNINQRKYLDRIKNFDPDFIISSNSLYFGKEILSMPKYHCINRHSAMLPSYGGLWPVFWAVLNNEKEVGVSVHKMTSSIDEGGVLAQQAVSIDDGDTIDDLYDKCFRISADVCLEAIKNVLEQKEFSPSSDFPQSYYSFPKYSDWKKFRERGIKFI